LMLVMNDAGSVVAGGDMITPKPAGYWLLPHPVKIRTVLTPLFAIC
jgi:hypothetical protein